ncbi:MAG: hypothetical protein HZC36_06595 [Armatimonadetes bacterium]|nr:hypothetical protein [Armatimonadota bacterium]
MSALHTQSNSSISNVEDLKGVSELRFAVGYPTLDMLIVSDDGKVLVQYDVQDGTASAADAMTGAHVWSVSLADSAVASSDKSAIPSDNFLPVACPDEGRLLCVRRSGSESNTQSTNQVDAIGMFTIRRNGIASAVFGQTRSFGTATGMLESKVSAHGVRIAIIKGGGTASNSHSRNTSVTVAFATLRDSGLTFLTKSSLTASERKLVGLAIPLCEPNLPKELRTFPNQKEYPTSADIENGLIAYLHGDSYFDAYRKRFVRLPRQEKGWRIESTAARGRVWAWTSWTPREAKPSLFVTSRGGTWKRVGNFQLAGRSANGKFLLLHQPKRIGATPGRFLLVELK